MKRRNRFRAPVLGLALVLSVAAVHFGGPSFNAISGLVVDAFRNIPPSLLVV